MSTIEAWGISFDSPAGVEAAIFRNNAREQPDVFSCLHTASFSLPSTHQDGGFGQRLVEEMTDDDVVVVIFEYGPDSYVNYDAVKSAEGGFQQSEPMERVFNLDTAAFADRGLPRTVDAASFRESVLPQVGMMRAENPAGMQVFFSVGGRPFALFACAGSTEQIDRQVPRINEILGAIEIQPAVAIQADLRFELPEPGALNGGVSTGEAHFSVSSAPEQTLDVSLESTGSSSREKCDQPLRITLQVTATLEDGRATEMPAEVTIPPGLTSGIAETCVDGIYGMPLPTPFRLSGDVCEPDSLELSLSLFPLASRFS